MLDANWETYINRAVNKHFQAIAEAANVPLYIEGQPIDNDDPEHFELKIPNTRQNEQSKDFFRIDVDILVAYLLKDMSNIYKPHERIGRIQAAIIPIEVLDDSDDSIGCLVLRSDLDRPIDSINWGKVGEAYVRSVEAFYKLELSVS